MKEVNIKGEYIRLDSLLKFVGAVPTGGTAKILITSGEVSVDGEVCTMRGKKIREGNVVKVENEEYGVQASCT